MTQVNVLPVGDPAIEAELARRVRRTPPPPVDLPTPSTPARPAHSDELPKAALDLGLAADKLGWDVEARFSRGPLLGNPRGDGIDVLERDVAAVSLRFWRTPRPRRPDAVAVWTKRAGKAWAFTWAWTYRDGGMVPAKSTALRPFLKENAQ